MITNGKRVLELVSGNDLIWHHKRGTPCAVQGCNEEIRYREMRRFQVGNRTGITFAYLCIACAMDACNKGEAILR